MSNKLVYIEIVSVALLILGAAYAASVGNLEYTVLCSAGAICNEVS